jgi:hypothetical protein
MVRLVTIVGIAAVLLMSGTSAGVDDLAGTAWNLQGRLRVVMPRVDRFEEHVTGTAVFTPADNPAGDWCVVNLEWDSLLQFAGTPRRSPRSDLILDPGEGETFNSFDKAFGDTIREELMRRLGTESLDSMDVEVYVLRTAVNGYRSGGQERLRVGVKVLFRYIGWKAGRSAKVLLKLWFDGKGPSQPV